MSKKLLGQLLKSFKIISEEQIQEALQYQQENMGVKIGEALLSLGYVTDEQLCQALSKQLGLPMVRLSDVSIPDDLLSQVPEDVVHDYKVVPVKKKGRVLMLASQDPFDIFALDELRFRLGFDVEVVLTPSKDLTDAISKYYGLTQDQYDEMYEQLTESDIVFGRQEEEYDEEDGDDAPVIRLVHKIIADAAIMGASDVHVEPMEKSLRIRYRNDGICVEQDSPPKRLQPAIIQRLKILAKMDIAEKRKCQDGRIKVSVDGRDIDLRVSVIPTHHGESVVMRILDKENALVDMEVLGFLEGDMEKFEKLIKRPNGIILVTGPTGSGKTTTLYSSLKRLNKPNVKIITAEDPVEYHLDGINQCQVRHNINLNFARILRAMLRQAPNIILVGEIRDKETAEIAIQASLTGHLVFSTLHTNDAPTAIVRLTDIGVKPFLVASAVQCAMGQRLIRLLCTNCKTPIEPTAVQLRMVGLTPEDIEGKTIYEPVGCSKCYQGFKGRKGIYEIMMMNNELREMCFQKAPIHELRALARSTGMTTLQEDGVKKVLAGWTSFEEILAQTHREDLTL